MELKRISQALWLYTKRQEASSGPEASKKDRHQDGKTKKRGNIVDGRRPVGRGKSGSTDNEHGRKMSLRRALAWKIKGRASSHDDTPPYLTDPRYPAAQLAAGLRKYGSGSPPRGTLDDEKLEYLTWRMLVLSVKQTRDDANAVEGDDEAASEVPSGKQARVELTSGLSPLVQQATADKGEELEEAHETPARPCAARQSSSAAMSSSSQSSPSDAPSSLFANRGDAGSSASSSSSSFLHAESRPSPAAPKSAAMIRCVDDPCEDVIVQAGVAQCSEQTESAQGWHDAVAIAQQQNGADSLNQVKRQEVGFLGLVSLVI